MQYAHHTEVRRDEVELSHVEWCVEVSKPNKSTTGRMAEFDVSSRFYYVVRGCIHGMEVCLLKLKVDKAAVYKW